MKDEIIGTYKTIGRIVKDDAGAENVIELLLELHKKCINFLSSSETENLTSKVANKDYFAFLASNKKSRAVNSELFIENVDIVEQIVNAIISKNFGLLNPTEITKALYSMAISFCCAIDLLKTGDQKTPGTFFEYFICHWFSRTLGIQPKKEIQVLNLDMDTTLPTDYIFDLGKHKPKIHLPVKTSTRERVIQAWAHQRLLDGVYGAGRFFGILVCLSETKVDKEKMEVVEICLPDQWHLYQMFISQMTRIYYLDTPTRYLALNDIFPRITVKPFGEFFYEVESLCGLA